MVMSPSGAEKVLQINYLIELETQNPHGRKNNKEREGGGYSGGGGCSVLVRFFSSCVGVKFCPGVIGVELLNLLLQRVRSD